MSDSTWAVVIGAGAIVAVYLSKRLIDLTFPPGTHFPWLDRILKPNKAAPSEEESDEQP